MIPLGTPAAESGISVVVPTLNDRDGLDQLIRALAQQTRAPDELVGVDGGTTDGTVELPLKVRRLAQPTISTAPRQSPVRATPPTRLADLAWLA